MRSVKIFLILGLSLAFFSCAGRSTGMISVKGTVKYQALEGGFYGIEGDDGTHYDPVSPLPEEFQQPGLRVKFKARKNENLVGFHEWGMYVEVLEIKKA